MRRLPALCVALLASAVVCPRLEALDPQKPLRDFGLVSWQQELPQATVHAIVQTRDGYLWFGTYEGLVRFDGVAFRVFDRRTTPELGNSKDLGNASISALFEDRSGALWIGTPGGGAVRYENGAFRRFTEADGLPDVHVFAFCEDAAGALWAGTNEGVARFVAGRFEKVPGVDVTRVRNYGLVRDREGSVWIAAEQGLVRARNGVATVFTAKDGLANAPRALSIDRDGTLWVGTEGGGVSRLVDGRFAALTTKDGLAGDSVRALLQDREGSLWIGTEGGGVSRLRGGALESLTPGDGLPGGLVRSLCEDAEGNLWIGTNGGGLVCLKDQKVTTYGARHGLTNVNVRSVFQDRAGSLWVGTDGGGLFRCEAGRFTAVRSPDGFPGDFVRALAEDPAGALWVATIGSGLTRLEKGRFTHFGSADGLVDHTLTAALAARDGTIWVGTGFHGVQRFAHGAFARESSAQPLATRPIAAFLETTSGDVWIGSNGHGLAVFSNGAFRVYTRADGLPSNQIFTFHEDGNGAVWIGTDGGIARYEGGRFASATTANGLFDDVVFSILEDEQGRLWTSSNRGIASVPRADLERVLDGRARAVAPFVLGVSDGMAANQCNGGSTPPAWRARDGRLYFATVRGLSMVDPKKMPRNVTPPPVQLEEVIANGRTLPRGPAARLAPGLEKLEIHYTAASFRAPERVRFRYRLEGYEREWTDAGTRRTAYYTGLPPGRFRFRVVACNDEGLWNETGASLALELLPPWWRTWWAYGLDALALVLVMFGIVRLRVRTLERRTEELERKVEVRTAELAEANRAKSVFLANMSHELRTPLNAILGFAQLMGRGRGRSREDAESLAIIGKSGEHLLGLINDVLSLSKIEAGRVEVTREPFDPAALVRALVGVVSARASAKSLELSLQTRGLPAVVVGDEQKLRQILLNLLSNAVRLTARGRVALRASWVSGRGAFEVEDTGPGIAPEETSRLFQPFVQTEAGVRSLEGTGLGLALSRQLARLMGGDITVTSVPGEGATFRLEVDLPQAEAPSLRAAETRRVVGLADGASAPRVLVVDDVPENRLVLTRLLGSVGFDVREAVSGEEAIEAWRTFAPDLVFMDKRMPGIGGLEATRRIRREEGEGGRARTAIVALSASAMEHERGEILASGCDAFVAKPFREATIFEEAARLLGVRYVHEDGEAPASAPSIDPARVRRLPEALREELRRAFASGDFDAAEEAAARVTAHDDALADALLAAARSYEADEALAALGTARRGTGSP